MNILFMILSLAALLIIETSSSVLEWCGTRRPDITRQRRRTTRLHRRWNSLSNYNQEETQEAICDKISPQSETDFGSWSTRAVSKVKASVEDVDFAPEKDEIPSTPDGERDCDELSYFDGRNDGFSRRGFILEDGIIDQQSIQLVNRVKMWPPWPLNLLTRPRVDSHSDHHDVPTAANTYPSAAALFWAYFRQRARVGFRQVQEVGSQLWFNLPPAAPPLILLASIPRTIVVENKETGAEMSKRIVPLISNSFARNLALSGLGLAVMSWAHMEINRKKKLTPLELNVKYQSVSKVFLPPYLPEHVPEPEIEALESAEKTVGGENKQNGDGDGASSVIPLVSPRLRKQLNQLYDKAPRPTSLQTTYREWVRMREARKRESAKIRRLSIFDELVALQALKRKRARLQQSAENKSGGKKLEKGQPGYALVTGASQGIGRSIAVELARWEIPLILVARDIDRLTSLAYDLEACYGVKCCVLQADLSKTNSAEQIYETTNTAGLCVDILVNNAGLSSEGLSVDVDIEDVERMVMVNAMTYAKLSRLYGRDMKERRRGRILMVSSMCGLTSASPNTAVYGATKAFAKSLSLSMAKELEPHGVGVTCLMPGPVVGTEFRSRSGTEQAACWYLPFYARPARSVAHQGVMSLLDGDTQAIPGVVNRVFSKLFRPILPQRVEVIAVHIAWSPFSMKLPNFLRRRGDEIDESKVQDRGSDIRLSVPKPQLLPRYNSQLPPRLLKLPEPEIPKVNTTEISEIEEHTGDPGLNVTKSIINGTKSDTPKDAKAKFKKNELSEQENPSIIDGDHGLDLDHLRNITTSKNEDEDVGAVLQQTDDLGLRSSDGENLHPALEEPIQRI